MPRLGVGTMESRKAKPVSATTAQQVRRRVEAERHLWFPLKLKGPIIFQEAGGVKLLQSALSQGLLVRAEPAGPRRLSPRSSGAFRNFVVFWERGVYASYVPG